MSASPSANRKALPEDVLKDLRDHARTYFKLDLTYVAAIGAALATVKFARPAMFESIASLANYGYVLIALILFDTFIAAWLTDEWFDVKCGLGEGMPRFSRLLARAQPVAHAVFITTLLMLVIARSEGFYAAIWIRRAEVELQDSVERFALHTKRYPASFDELEREDQSVASIVVRLKGEQFSYERIGDHDYRLTFKHHQGGYPENRVATHEFQLQPILEEVEKTTPIP